METPNVPEIMDDSPEEKLTRVERNFFHEVEQDLTPRQIEVLKNICHIEKLPKSKNQFLKMIGVAKSTWHFWKEDSVFLSALNRLSQIRHADDLLWADDSIAEKAREGDIQAGRYLREVLGIKPERGTTPAQHVHFHNILPSK